MSQHEGLEVYDSLAGEQRSFEPSDPDHVRMYVCGQTVYDNMHIGHGRTYIAFDIIRRYLEYRGYGVEVVINLTDVNDKINDRAPEEGLTPRELADKYGRINLEDFEQLGIEADSFPKASDYVAEMQEMVRELIEKGHAYEAGGNVFFDVRSFDDYGKLSNQSIEDISGDRDDIQGIEDKHNEEDFVLWRSRDPDETDGPTWESPWGVGVPGWHIECSAMSSALLGDQFDIHGGGADLNFPHHEDEIAQAEAYSGEQPWVKYWMHTGLVRLKDQKMSKSIGNFVPTRELLDEHDPRAIRLMVAGTHYRKPFDFSQDRIEEAEDQLDSFDRTLADLDRAIEAADVIPEKPSGQEHADDAVIDSILDRRSAFIAAMDDDFNTPEALSELYALQSHANRYVDEREVPSRAVLERFRRTLVELGEVIGIVPEQETGDGAPAEAIDAVLGLREELREEGEYDAADRIRDVLADAGLEIEDTGDGAHWRRS